VRGVEATGYGDPRVGDRQLARCRGRHAPHDLLGHAVALADDGSGTQTGYIAAAVRSRIST
jgi:hypothetical protein